MQKTLSELEKNGGRVYSVDQLHIQASDEGPGTHEQPFKTISRAATCAQPGDTILVHAGIYCEHVAPARGGCPGQPITYMAAPGETVVIRGSELWQPDWQALAEHERVFSAPLNPAWFPHFNPYQTPARCLPGKKNLGQLFLAGQPLLQVETQEELVKLPGTWLTVNTGEALQVHFPLTLTEPQQQTLEVTTRASLFSPHQRGLGYITIRGFIFEHCANQFPALFWEDTGHPQAGAVSCRSGHHWIIEHNIIRWANAIGLDCGSEGLGWKSDSLLPGKAGYHLIRHNIISDNGACGIAGADHVGTKIIGNIIERNNNLGWTAAEEAGIKMHYFVDGLIEGNLVRDNDAHGIWLDNVWYGSRITRNVVINNLHSGIFIEMGDGPCLIDHNIIAYTRQGEGIYTHDSSGVTIVHNLLYGNTHFGVYSRIVSERYVETADHLYVKVGTSRQRILNNVFIDNYRGHICLPLPTEGVEENISDYNLLINGTQWQWEGLGRHCFVLNTNDGRIAIEQLVAALTQALDEHNIALELRPNLQLWIEQPFLTLEWWRLLTHNDCHSFASELQWRSVPNEVHQKGTVNLSARGTYLQLHKGEWFNALHCPPVAGIEHDFRDQPLPEQKLLPGPFQHIHPGFNHIILWPPSPSTPHITSVFSEE